MEFRMTAITAKDNPSIQLYRKLVRQRKARTQNQQFVLEGYRLVTDAVHFPRKLTHLFLTEAADLPGSYRSNLGTLSGRILLFRG